MEKQKKSKSSKGLLRALQLHGESLRDTFQMLNEPAPAVVDKVPWSDVKKAAEQISKQATTTGLLLSGNPTAQEATEKIENYINELQGFLLLCHGSTVGAGPTLLSVVQNTSKQVLDTSLTLLENALSVENQAARGEALPALTGCVWEACESVKKAPSDNRTAVGRGLVQVGTSIKDVLREMNEIEADEGSTSNDGDNSDLDSSADMLNFDIKLSPAEVKIAEKVKDRVGAVLEVIKQLLYVVSKVNGTTLEYLENILQYSRSISKEVDELGASVYPPQEIDQLKERSQNIDSTIKLFMTTVISLHGSVPEALASACERAHDSHVVLEDSLAVVIVTENLQSMKF